MTSSGKGDKETLVLTGRKMEARCENEVASAAGWGLTTREEKRGNRRASGAEEEVFLCRQFLVRGESSWEIEKRS